jgi:hypothetical protein
MRDDDGSNACNDRLSGNDQFSPEGHGQSVGKPLSQGTIIAFCEREDITRMEPSCRWICTTAKG